MKILTQADIDEALFPFDRGSSFSEIARAVEAKIMERINNELADARTLLANQAKYIKELQEINLSLLKPKVPK